VSPLYRSVYIKIYAVKIYVRKIDDTLVPELVRIDVRKLRRRRIKLEDLYIFLDDINPQDGGGHVRSLLEAL
jgi:hypothetical protein